MSSSKEKPESTRQEGAADAEAPSKPFAWDEDAEFKAPLPSALLFWWLQPLFNRATELHKVGEALEQDDLAPLPKMDGSHEVQERFIANKSEKLHISLYKVIKSRLLVAGAIKFVNTSLQFTFPLLLQAILKYLEEVQSGETESRRGYWLSVLLMLMIASKAITESAYFHRVNRCGWQVKTAVSAAVYEKSLRLSSSAQQSTTLGEMVNLMQVDSTKLEAFVPQIHVLWDGLFQISGYMTILGTLLGWPCLIGLVVMMFAGPVMGIIMGKLFGVNRAMVKDTDERVKAVNEALQGIRCVKMYTWEDSLAKSVAKARAEEMKSLQTIAVLRGFSRAYITALPTVAAIATFLVWAYATDRPVVASTLFASIVAFDQLRFPLMFYPMALAQYAQASVSLKRVSDFLALGEVEKKNYYREPEGEGEILIENASLYWSDPEVPLPSSGKEDEEMQSSQHTTMSDGQSYPKAILSDISLQVNSKELCAVVGRVGSGKSTLCASILNETVLGKGSSVTLRGSVAYVAQSAWILNKSVRDNILFGLPYDESRYQQILDICQLQHDLSLLDDGDLTEIGERGINLSGGQKQRISLARAAYSNASVILLDDPLSALDPETAAKVFEECIVKFLSDRTRLLVTNQLLCLPRCDQIIALGKRKVLEQGTYEDLMEAKDGEVHRLLTELGETSDEEGEKEQSSKVEKKEKIEVVKDATPGPKAEKKETHALTTKEEREVGAVKLGVYLKYMKAGGGVGKFAMVYLAFILCTGISLMSTVWISLWSSDPLYERASQEFYLAGYALTGILLGLFTFVRSYLLATFGVRASNNLHNTLLRSIFNAPMSFFDTTPTGRILSRFSKDMHTIDQELADYFDFVIFMSLLVITTIAVIIYATPIFAVVLLPVMYVYIRILNYFREVSRETKRLESISRSPVYAHFSETLGGLSTIRAYSEAQNFIKDFVFKLDASTQAMYNNKTADRWLAVRLELIGALIAGLAAVLSTQSALSSGTGNSTFASIAGLSLTGAISITGMLNWVVRSFAQVEAAMNSCERVFYYSESIPQEAGDICKELEDKGDSGPSPIQPPAEWPTTGGITMKNLSMRYREETPLVLKGLDVKIEGGQKIGVVGRTGSGKSSLLLCLMRIVEPDLSVSNSSYEAPLEIDGVDVLRIGLFKLRSKLGIIPQTPVLFSGTIRSNMDPFDNYSDAEVWAALEQCGLKATVLEMPNELDAPVAEYGENLSQGQRQLLCLGRALLKQSRILLLDEATSSVDFETDREIQRIIREAFKERTVLTIAHRVDTIMDSDKVLVLKDGQVAEFAPPKELLADQSSLFSEIVRHAQNEEEE